MILDKKFYNRNTLEVAQDLLGCFLVRKIGNKVIKTRIVETEAYMGPNDLASHASRGKTARNKVMFGGPGIIYIYLVYGMHYMLNIVTEDYNYPAAVLIRAVETEKESGKTNGPAKLTKFLQINKSFNDLPIYNKKTNLWIEEWDKKIKSSQIKKARRVGIDYAGVYKNKLWRFYIKDSKEISVK